MDVKEIQNTLYHTLRVRGHWAIAPNIFIFPWESDLFSILKSGRSCEFEIKTSRSDFRADFKKVAKHQILKTGSRPPDYMEKLWLARGTPGINIKLDENGMVACPRPNYFWYCCPKGLIKPEEVPEYAGLMYITGSYYQNDVKKPPLLHKDTYDPRWIERLLTAINFRYWDYRINNNQIEL